MKQVLVTGGGGQVGRALARFPWPDGWEAIALGRDALDLADPLAIARAVAERPWAGVISNGAYTAVDKAEQEPIAAWTVNALAPAAIAQACAKAGIPLVHVSTDYVFDGEAEYPRRPDDPASPINVYGASKLGGELAVRTAGGRHAIVRTSWVVSPDGQNFVKTMLRLAGELDLLRVVDDQRGAPTSAADLAAALAAITMRLADDPDAPTGTFHFTDAGTASWADFASAILARSALRGGPSAAVERIATADFPTPARRPRNSLLDCSSTHEAFGISARPWMEALDEILDELIGPKQ
jgi:dTDP-4-dehydrorhamnose reductase